MNDLRAELESLRQENARLRKLLKMTDAEAAPAQGSQIAWFDRAPGPVDGRSGGWRKGRSASAVRHLPLTPEVIAAHLTGDTHVGLYPMLPGDKTCWLAADCDAL